VLQAQGILLGSRCSKLLTPRRQGRLRKGARKAKSKSPFDLDGFLPTANSGRTITKYKKDATIVSQGDPCAAVFYIRNGTCSVTVVSEQGKEAVVALHEKGAFFGEGCLNGQVRHVSTVTAFSDCEIMRFDKAAIRREIADEPKFLNFSCLTC
jgi:CRP-like cAMP-binding protein